VPLLARLMTDLAPGSLVMLRLPSALAAALLVYLTALLTREAGAGRTAQLLACAVIALAPVVTGSSHLLSTTTFSLPDWALLAWLLLRILRTGNQRLWLPAGLAAGVGLLDTDLVAFLIVAVVVSLLIAGPRAVPLTLVLRRRAGRACPLVAVPGLAGPARLARARGRAGHRQRPVRHVGTLVADRA
jgi:Dolichyl-phosphate-mannose-protein mannosyltransferase